MISEYVHVMPSISLLFGSNNMLNKNTLGVKKCEANQKQHCKQVRPKTLIPVEAKKLLIKNLFNNLRITYNSL